MKTDVIRKKFLDFFQSKGHKVLASDSVVPKNDPTVLFTTAGMQQFKLNFLGIDKSLRCAATSQKCLRTDDLDKIGKTPCHHTFFEMLGNFSFGDYFKKDAIAYAWEFLTKHMNLSADRLWVSVYEQDQEAYDEWVKLGFPKEKIVKLGDKDNFWPAEAQKNGPNGPCGPCSEIFFDYGVNPNCKSKKCDPSCSCGRFTEVWNLVFTQFNRKDGGVLEPLPGKNIDTGMGLERLAAVVQGKKNNYDIDIFIPILKAIDSNIPELAQKERFIIADHIRAITFGISDGVVPSNEGRGYVIKKLVNDVTDIALRAGLNKPVIYKLVAAVADTMRQSYPEIMKKQKEIEEIVQAVEKAYIKVRQERLPEFERKAKEAKSADELGQLLFLYRDTYGLGDNTLISSAADLSYFKEGFAISQNLMEQQKERSRAGSKMTGDRFADIEIDLTKAPKTTFIGYEKTEGQGKILNVFSNGKEVKEASDGSYVKIILDQTPFYAEAGGQVGDTGVLIASHGKIRIEDTQKISDVYIHSGVVTEGTIKEGDKVQAKIDAERRADIMKNHTATHLLQAALRGVLGTHVKQQGSLVAPDRLRFDFAHPKAIGKDELKKIEDQVNANVKAAIPVQKEVLSLEEAKKKGALAFFAEKYGETVRVISIGDVSKEFCGGTHLTNTKEIGNFIVTSEGAVAQGIRRLEAKTGREAIAFLEKKKESAQESENLAKVRQQEAEQEKKRYAEIIKSLEGELKSITEIKGTKILTKTIADVKVDTLKMVTDYVKQTAKSSAAILGSQTNGSATIVIAITDDLVKKGISAGDVVKAIAPVMNGSGGGRPQLAQAGGKEPGKLQAAMKQAEAMIREKI